MSTTTTGDSDAGLTAPYLTAPYHSALRLSLQTTCQFRPRLKLGRGHLGNVLDDVHPDVLGHNMRVHSTIIECLSASNASQTRYKQHELILLASDSHRNHDKMVKYIARL